jgi:hypothetical protein
MIELKGSKSAAEKVAMGEDSCCRAFMCCDEDILNDCTLRQRQQGSGVGEKGVGGVWSLRLFECCSEDGGES